jgi:hypothetical protein
LRMSAPVPVEIVVHGQHLSAPDFNAVTGSPVPPGTEAGYLPDFATLRRAVLIA